MCGRRGLRPEFRVAYTSDLIYPIHMQANSFQQKFVPTLQLWIYRELPKDP